MAIPKPTVEQLQAIPRQNQWFAKLSDGSTVNGYYKFSTYHFEGMSYSFETLCKRLGGFTPKPITVGKPASKMDKVFRTALPDSSGYLYRLNRENCAIVQRNDGEKSPFYNLTESLFSDSDWIDWTNELPHSIRVFFVEFCKAKLN